MKLNVLVLVGMGTLLAACLSGCKATPPPPPQPPPAPVKQFDPGDSPINIGGGSIFALNRAGGTWTPVPGTNGKVYSTTIATDATKISARGIAGISLSTTLSGYVIRISNKDRKHPEKVDAVRICSDPGCNQNPVTNNTVYARVRDDSAWTTSGNNELFFHDSTCAAGDSCDVFVKVTIKGPTGTLSGDCDDNKCLIGIGPPM